MYAQKEENKKNSSELINREPVSNTPFTLINYDNSGWFLTIGKYQLTKPGEFEKSELLRMVENKDWSLIMTMIAIIVNFELDNHTNQQS